MATTRARPRDEGREVSLKERAYSELKELILSGELQVNSFLSERRLAKQLGMSKTPIRLAVERLESEGFLLVSPQQGIVIKDLSLEEILDYIDYRAALESFVVRRLAGELSERQVDTLKSLVDRQFQELGNTRGEDSKAHLVDLDREFHLAFCRILGNRQILAAMERQSDMLFRVADRVFRTHPARLEQSFEEHRELVAAVEKGEADRAAQLVSEHIGKIKRLMVG